MEKTTKKTEITAKLKQLANKSR